MNLALLLLLVVLALAIYGAYHLTKNARQVFVARRCEHQQGQEDERTFWDYDAKHKAIRAKFDPNDEWNEATSLPTEYTREIRELNLKHRKMLQRRNGWTARDFEDSTL